MKIRTFSYSNGVALGPFDDIWFSSLSQCMSRVLNLLPPSLYDSNLDPMRSEAALAASFSNICSQLRKNRFLDPCMLDKLILP